MIILPFVLAPEWHSLHLRGLCQIPLEVSSLGQDEFYKHREAKLIYYYLLPSSF